MNNSFVANAMNKAVQNFLSENATLGDSIQRPGQKSFTSDNVDAVKHAQEGYHRVKKAADFIFSFRSFCRQEGYNEYETGRYLSSLSATPDFQGCACNPAECSALAVYFTLRAKNLDQVNIAIVLDPENVQNRQVLHEFVIIGEVTGEATAVSFLLKDVDSFLSSNLLAQSDPPWVIDATLDLACPLVDYPQQLGNAISKITHEGDVLSKVRPPLGKVHHLGDRTLRRMGSERANKLLHLYQFGQEVEPMAMYNLIYAGKVVAIEVTPGSKRIEISENDGLISSGTFF
ncbi:hypothetical protein [Endozoicomonas euniceicola]|uniref:Uncharacterized protein n=1 Tax=Endozoicomonas euniceicola TaxID=1234143 RepID=A0ABY6GUV1_9GAMM|nr:hypothetical protein [Endozoicomonas euniceicola]UYM15724.1 hypothetical protein NX720_23325 [Endozoicomonas euniceicola]